jgi:hypothetical protein
MKAGIRIPIFVACLAFIVGLLAAASSQSLSGAVAVSANKNITASCVETSKVGIKGFAREDFCCRLMQRTASCTFIGGVMDIPYNYNRKTGIYDNYFPATHICTELPKAGGSGVYANYEIIGICQSKGYEITVN